MAGNDAARERRRNARKAQEARKQGRSALPSNFTRKAREAAKNTTVKSHKKRELPGNEKYAYQAKVTGKTSEGETFERYSHTYGFSGDKPPTRGEIYSRVSQGESEDPDYDNEAEITGVEIINSWEDG